MLQRFVTSVTRASDTPRKWKPEERRTRLRGITSHPIESPDSTIPDLRSVFSSLRLLISSLLILTLRLPVPIPFPSFQLPVPFSTSNICSERLPFQFPRLNFPIPVSPFELSNFSFQLSAFQVPVPVPQFDVFKNVSEFQFQSFRF